MNPRRVSPFLAWGDFTRAHVSLALLSLRKNGVLLVVYFLCNKQYLREVEQLLFQTLLNIRYSHIMITWETLNFGTLCLTLALYTVLILINIKVASDV